LALAPHAALAEKRVALIIGNSNYRNVARLPNPEKDATAMAKLFQNAGFETVVTATDVGNLDFKRAVRKFEDATVGADIAVVFYAGHGIEIGGVNYLVPVDAKLASDRDAQDEAITLERLVEAVDGAKRLRLIIMDACRDNPFVATMKRVRRTAMRGISSGLGKVEPAGTDTLIAYAAKAGSTAEDGEGANSPFTTALLANLTVPGLDVRLAFGRVRDQVMKITDSRQEPFVYGSLGGGNISLVPAPTVEKQKDSETAAVKTDYELVAQIGTKKAWEVFLSTYKTGFYADLARAQLAKLELKIASLEPPPPPEPAKPTSDELRAWNKIRETGNKEALDNFIERFPNSPLALNAQKRIDVLERAAREREEKAQAELEREQKARAERETAQQSAEQERHAQEAARIAELRAENERRGKQAAESEAQKKGQAAHVATAQSEIDRRTNELAKSDKQEIQLACKNEQIRLDDLKAAGSSASVRDDLKRLSQDLTCESIRPQVVASLDKVTSELTKSAAAPPANTPELIASAQKHLARLGCYSGDHDGKLDAETKVAIKKYQTKQGLPVDGVEVTGSFVSELSKLKLRVCPAAVVAKPKPKDTRKEAKQERNKSAKSEAKPQARQQASSGGHATMIGVGF
jgi:outer membrane protein assembly factor BamD (BamD/ComL family)